MQKKQPEDNGVNTLTEPNEITTKVVKTNIGAQQMTLRYDLTIDQRYKNMYC